jgi:hypothetical protein
VLIALLLDLARFAQIARDFADYSLRHHIGRILVIMIGLAELWSPET